MRLRTLLKWLPVSACALLLLAWIASAFASFGLRTHLPYRSDFVVFECSRGTMELALNVYAPLKLGPFWHPYTANRPLRPLLGFFQLRFHAARGIPVLEIDVPIPCLLTAILPLAVGAFIRFRFPLWMWLAYVTLVSAECAYYLRSSGS